MIHGVPPISQVKVIESMCPSSFVQVVPLASPEPEVPAESAKPMVDDESEKCFVDILSTQIVKLTELYFATKYRTSTCFRPLYFPMC